MNKRNRSFLLSCLCLPLFVHAQNAVWQIHPEYNKIEIYENSFCVGQKQDSVFFWKMDGTLIHKDSKLKVSALKNEASVVLEAGTSNVRGVLTNDGKYYNVQEKKYTISNDYPYFSDGYLCVMGNDGYYFLDKTGRQEYGPFPQAYPFSHGIALVKKYQNPEKKKDEYFDYLSSISNETILPQVNRSDIDFASSTNSEGYSIVVMDKKVYKYNTNGGGFEQMSTDGTMDKKSRVITQESHPILLNQDGNFVLTLKQGQMIFDNRMALKEIHYIGRDPIMVKEAITVPYEYTSDMTRTDKEGGLYGILYKEKEFLPHQFKDVYCLTNNLAIVAANKGTGILRVYPEDNLEFQLNNNKKIDFLHPTYQTKVMVKMPAYMKAKLGKIEAVNKDNVCIINNTSRNNIENEEVTAIEYECELQIPQDLPTEEVCKMYHFSMNYDGIRTREYEICASMWYVMQYVVEITKQDFSVAADAEEIEVEFQLAKSSFVLDSDNMNHSISISVVNQDNQEIEYTKIRENLYSFKVQMDNKDQQTFNIRVNEEGCPYVNYPHTVTVSQPVEIGKNKKASTKKVIIKQKKKAPVFIPQ